MFHPQSRFVALRKESVDRNKALGLLGWLRVVALRKESVDRNLMSVVFLLLAVGSLSARRAWIEISPAGCWRDARRGRSPQGERG